MYEPVCSSAVGQPRCMTLEAWWIQSIAVTEALEGTVAGVCVRGRAFWTGLSRTDVTLRARRGAGGLTLYRGGTGGVEAPHRHPAQKPGGKRGEGDENIQFMGWVCMHFTSINIQNDEKLQCHLYKISAPNTVSDVIDSSEWFYMDFIQESIIYTNKTIIISLWIHINSQTREDVQVQTTKQRQKTNKQKPTTARDMAIITSFLSCIKL